MAKKIAILTGGGDVPPLNALIAAALESARRSGARFIGYLEGWRGVLEDRAVDLTDFKLEPAIGGTVLKSSRVNILKV